MAEKGKKLVQGIEPLGTTVAGIIVALIMAVATPVIMSIMYGLAYPYTYYEVLWAFPGLMVLGLLIVIHLPVRLLTAMLSLGEDARITALVVSAVLTAVFAILAYAGLTVLKIAVWQVMVFAMLAVLGAAITVAFVVMKITGAEALTAGDAALIYLASTASGSLPVAASFLLGHITFVAAPKGNPAYSYNGTYVPDIWVPKSIIDIDGHPIHILNPIYDRASRELLLSRGDWVGIVLGAWGPALAYWILLFAALAMAQIGFAILVRKQWIEEEMLPFPYAQAAVELIRAGGFRGAYEHRRESLLWLGLGGLVAFLMMLPIYLVHYQVLPSDALPGWYGALVAPGGGYNDFAKQIYESTGLYMAISPSISPLFLGLALLMPIDILITAVVWYVIMYIVLPPIEVSQGIVTQLSGPTDAQTIFYTVGHHQGLMPHFISRGMMIGLPIAWLLFSGIAIMRGTKPTDPGFLMLAGGFLVAWILLSVAGINPAVSLLIVLLTMLLYITWMRLRGETSWLTGMGFYGPWYHEMLVLPWLPYRESGNYNSPEAYAAAMSFYPLVTDRTLAAIPGPAVLEGFKLAKITGIDYKKIILVGVIAALSGIVIGFIVTLLGFYAYGISGVSGGKWVGGADRSLEPQWVSTMVKTGQIEHMANDTALWLPQFLIGIVLAVVLVWLKTIFVGLPINPLGIVLGDQQLTGVTMFIPNLIALIVKPLFIRVFGVEQFEKIIIPFAAGMILLGFFGGWVLTVDMRSTI